MSGRLSPATRAARAGGLGSEAGLRAAWEAHAGELGGFARRALRDPGAAEDVVQETFVRAWRAWRRFDPARGTMRAWLFAICRNVLCDVERARAVRPPLVACEPRADEGGAVDPGFERALLGLHVEQALGRLAPHHRQVLVEVALRDRPVAEVARRLGVPEGTIHSRVFYASRAMRTALVETGLYDAA
jgi:RNA polymerase sigma-70 factor, ECF subfamily